MGMTKQIKMMDATGCYKCSTVIMLGNNYSKEQFKQKLEQIKARKKIKDRAREFEALDRRLKLIKIVWNLCNASEELVNCRLEVEKQLIAEQVEKKPAKVEKNYKSFEQRLAEDVMKKYKDDVQRNIIIKSKKYYENINKNIADAITIPEIADRSDAELKDIDAVRTYIHDKVTTAYRGEKVYPDEIVTREKKDASTESTVETIGV